MIQRCYTVYDRKALTYGPPFYAVNHGMAIRLITDTVADPNTSLARHPNDYVCYFIATYDDQTGKLAPINPLEHVIDVISCISEKRQAELFQIGEKE